jgi:hypothetical protein
LLYVFPFSSRFPKCSFSSRAKSMRPVSHSCPILMLETTSYWLSESYSMYSFATNLKNFPVHISSFSTMLAIRTCFALSILVNLNNLTISSVEYKSQ